MKGLLTTYTGQEIDLCNPQPEAINIIDIAHGLSGEGRFANQRNRFLSVAEHCVMGLIYLDGLNATEEVKRSWFLHDAPEAYVLDIPKPLKELLPEYGVIEKRLYGVIAKKYDLYTDQFPEWKVVKQTDEAMYYLECNNLEWSKHYVKTTHEFWSPEKAFKEFIFHAHRLNLL